MAGLSYAHFTQYGYLRTTLAGDTTDNSNGIVWDMAVVSLHQRWPDRDPVLCAGTAKTRTNTIMAYRAKSPLAAVCVAITRTTAGALTELSASYNSSVTGVFTVRALHPSV